MNINKKVLSFFEEHKEKILDEIGDSVSSKILFFLVDNDIKDVEIVKDILKKYLEEKVYVFDDNNLILDNDYDKLNDLYNSIIDVFDYSTINLKNALNFKDVILDDEIVDMLMKIESFDIKYNLLLKLHKYAKLHKDGEKYVYREVELALKYDYYDEVDCISDWRTSDNCSDCCLYFKYIFKKNSKIIQLIGDRVKRVIYLATDCLWDTICGDYEYMDVYTDLILKYNLDMSDSFFPQLIENALEEEIPLILLFDILFKFLENDKNCKYSKIIIEEIEKSKIDVEFRNYIREKIHKEIFDNKCIEFPLVNVLDIFDF